MHLWREGKGGWMEERRAVRPGKGVSGVRRSLGRRQQKCFRFISQATTPSQSVPEKRARERGGFGACAWWVGGRTPSPRDRRQRDGLPPTGRSNLRRRRPLARPPWWYDRAVVVCLNGRALLSTFRAPELPSRKGLVPCGGCVPTRLNTWLTGVRVHVHNIVFDTTEITIARGQ